MSGSLANRLVEAAADAARLERVRSLRETGVSASDAAQAARSVAAVLRELDRAVMERVASGSSDFIDLEALAGVVEGGEQDG